MLICHQTLKKSLGETKMLSLIKVFNSLSLCFVYLVLLQTFIHIGSGCGRVVQGAGRKAKRMVLQCIKWCWFKSRRGKNKNLTALKSNSNSVWFNFQTYIYIYIYMSRRLCNDTDKDVTKKMFVLHRHVSTIRYSLSSLVGRFPQTLYILFINQCTIYLNNIKYKVQDYDFQ